MCNCSDVLVLCVIGTWLESRQFSVILSSYDSLPETHAESVRIFKYVTAAYFEI